MESSFQLMIAYDKFYYVKFTALSIKTCLLKHEMALSTDGTESVCGENAFPPLLFTLYFT